MNSIILSNIDGRIQQHSFPKSKNLQRNSIPNNQSISFMKCVLQIKNVCLPYVYLLFVDIIVLNIYQKRKFNTRIINKNRI